MKNLTIGYFQINQTVIGEAYFRVSQHLCTTISYVIKNKFHPDIRLLLNKYYNIIVAEQKEYAKIQEMQQDMPHF